MHQKMKFTKTMNENTNVKILNDENGIQLIRYITANAYLYAG